MQIVKTNVLSPCQREAVFALWNCEYPAAISYAGIAGLDAYLGGLQDQQHYFMMNGDTIAGWGFVFTRDAERWFAIIVARDAQGNGYGTRLLNRLKEDEPVLSGWILDHDDHKADGTQYRSPSGFYTKNNFTLVPGVRWESGAISTVKIGWKR